MPGSATTWRAFDGNIGAGYGTLKRSQLGADSQGEREWPYSKLTDLEQDALNEPDQETQSKRAIRKKSKRDMPADRLAQLNYKPHSFVNGSTRGLTGIMSGVDARAILEQVIDGVIEFRRRGVEAGSVFGQKPIGLGAPQANMMHPSGQSRTRPGQGYGSKLGWFGAPQPKESDPSNDDPAVSLKDIAKSDERRPVRRSNVIRRRMRAKSNVTEGNISLLRSYVQIVSRSP